MKSIHRVRTIGACAIAGLFLAAANASPVINGAALHTRVFNDDPGTVLNTVNLYPAQVQFAESGGTGNFANRHNFRLSDTAGASDAVFLNGDSFAFFTDLTVSGPGNAEAGVNVSPWWSQNVDGMFNCRTTDGEVAVFGGRLPFYSFTGSQGVTYVKGTTVRLGVIYQANGNSGASPATIQYWYNDGVQRKSPWLSFDQGNPGEDPPYGLWGMLNDARVGGYIQHFIGGGGGAITANFGNMNYVPEPTSLALLGVAAMFLRRKR